ncbi:protein transport protein SEC31 [Nematocida parisii]|nr:protein transport protein SEC31 [Nematocida parisii]KAI5156493.1 protein transport protein SEC31 [Nematocida parisii]
MKIETTSLVSFSPVGSLVALGTKAKILNSDFSSDSLLQIKNTETDETIFTKVVPSRFNRLEWGMYGDKVFVAGGLDAGNVTLLDATGLLSDDREDPKELVFKNHVKTDDDILGIDFAGAMPVLTTGSYSGKIMLWNLRTLDKPMAPGITTKFEGISCLQWNKNMPQILAVGTTDGMVSILDLRGKSEVTRIGDAYFSKSEITSLQWDPSPNSAQLAVSSSAQNSVILYDLRISRGTPRLEGHTEGILNCKWSRQDPSLIVTCGRDNSVIAWDANTYKKRGVVVEDSVFDFAFSPENPDMIAYSSYNGYVVMDTLTSLNARSPFLDKVPEWQKQGAGLCFTSQGLFVSEEKGLRLRKWIDSVDKSSYEWKVLDAYEREHPRREIMKILNASGEKSPILEQAEDEAEESSKPSQESSIEMDEEDPITEKLIQGNFSAAFSLALSENAHLAALIALCDGTNVLKREKERILKAPGASSSFLLVLSILSGDYSGLIKNNVDWTVIIKILGSHCTDEEFIPKVRAVAECLEKTDLDSAKICYLIAKDVQKYQEIEEKKAEKPKSIIQSVEFFKKFDKVFTIVERGAQLMKQKISVDRVTIDYLKHLMQKGEKQRVLSFINYLSPKSADEVQGELNLPATASQRSMQQGTGNMYPPHQQMNNMNIHQRTPQQYGGPVHGRPSPMPHQMNIPQKPNATPSSFSLSSREVLQPGNANPYNGNGMNSMPLPPQMAKQPPAHADMAPNSYFAPPPQMANTPMGMSQGLNRMPQPQNTVSAVATPNIGGRAGPKISYAKPQMPEVPLNKVAQPANQAAFSGYNQGGMPVSGSSYPPMPNTPSSGAMPPRMPYMPGQPRPMSGVASNTATPGMPPRMGVAGEAPNETPRMPVIPNGMPPVRPTAMPMQNVNDVGHRAPGMPQAHPAHSPFRPVPEQKVASHGAGMPRMPFTPNSTASTPNTGMGMGAPLKTPMMPGNSQMGTPFPDPMQNAYQQNRMGSNQSFPGGMHASHGYQQKQQEIVITPQMEKTYQDISKLVNSLLGMIHNKKGALKGWLLKSIEPKIVVLNKHLSEKKWSADFLSKMDRFLNKISELGVGTESSAPVTAEQLDMIRKEGDAICASRPYGTEIEIWMPAIYSLLKVALH